MIIFTLINETILVIFVISRFQSLMWLFGCLNRTKTRRDMAIWRFDIFMEIVGLPLTLRAAYEPLWISWSILELKVTMHFPRACSENTCSMISFSFSLEYCHKLDMKFLWTPLCEQPCVLALTLGQQLTSYWECTRDFVDNTDTAIFHHCPPYPTLIHYESKHTSMSLL